MSDVRISERQLEVAGAGIRSPPPRGGRPRTSADGECREQDLRVPVSPGERAELERLAGGGPLAPMLRAAPAEVERWRAVASALATALGNVPPCVAAPAGAEALAGYRDAAWDAARGPIPVSAAPHPAVNAGARRPCGHGRDGRK